MKRRVVVRVLGFGLVAPLTAIPIVMGAVGDPVASRFVTSLARPGGNVTGTSLLIPDLIGKQLQLLKEVAPRASRIGVISLGGASGPSMKEAEAAAPHHGVKPPPHRPAGALDAG